MAYGVGLENRSVEMHREFESHRFRQEHKDINMNSKDTIEKAFANVVKEVSNPNMFDWIQPIRGIRYYYLKLRRLLTR